MATVFSDGKESPQAISKRVMEKHGLDVILIGNPGAGKSTILSSLSGQHFECGVSFGKGLTTELQMEDDKAGRNIRWCDTAGFGDACVVQAEMAAKSIQDAIDLTMSNNRGTKIIFLCELDAGRVREADLYGNFNYIGQQIPRTKIKKYNVRGF